MVDNNNNNNNLLIQMHTIAHRFIFIIIIKNYNYLKLVIMNPSMVEFGF